MAENTAAPVLPDPRYQFRDAGSMQLTVERAPDLPPVEAGAELLDISQYGAKLLTSSCLRIHERIVLAIEVPELEQDYSLSAIVRWRQPAADATWRLGCVFTGELPEDVLAELAVLGYIERRQDQRQTVDVGAHVRWELAEEQYPVRIVSISAGGLCISCSEAGKTGERLLLRLGDEDSTPASIHARAAWQRLAGGRCLIGCTWAGREDYELLCSTLGLSPADGRADADSPRWRSILGLAVLVVAVISLVAYFLWS
jgi:hypothetical protein